MNKRTSLGFTPSGSRTSLASSPSHPLTLSAQAELGPHPPKEGAIFFLLVCPEACSPLRAPFAQATPTDPSPISSATALRSRVPAPPFRCRSWAGTPAWDRLAPRATPLSPAGAAPEGRAGGRVLLRPGRRLAGPWGGGGTAAWVSAPGLCPGSPPRILRGSRSSIVGRDVRAAPPARAAWLRSGTQGTPKPGGSRTPSGVSPAPSPTAPNPSLGN